MENEKRIDQVKESQPKTDEEIARENLYNLRVRHEAILSRSFKKLIK